MLRRIPLAVLMICGLAQALPAQPKPGYSPSSSHIFPAGGRRGTSVAVRVGGECLPPDTNLLVRGPGLSAPAVLGRRLPHLGEPDQRRKPTEVPITYPREWETKITIAPDTPLGAGWWRISCAQGGSGSRPFLVGDLPEWIESESNSRPATAEAVTLPITLNGQIYGERDADYFRFSLKKDQILVCDVLAGRIGSRLDPIIQLFDSNGQRLDAQEVRVGTDPVLALQAPRDGEYLLRVANITFHGNAACVYRITLTTRPHAVYVFPSGGRGGTETAVNVFTMTGSRSLAIRKQNFTLPKAAGWFRPAGTSGPQLVVDDRHNRLESEPNDTFEQAQAVELPTTLHGRLTSATDKDTFRFTVRKDQRYTFRCQAVPAGLPTLPVLVLFDGKGKQLVEAQAVKDPDREARIEWKAPADGDFQLCVRDLRFGSRGGPDFLYRLVLQPARPDFALFTAADSLNLVQAGSSGVDLRVKRLGGFAAPIQLAVEGLPEGVTVTPLQIDKGKTSVKLTFKATDEAASRSYPLSIIGSAKIDEIEITRPLQSRHLGIDSSGTSAGPTGLDRFHLTLCHKPVFRLFCLEAYLYAHRGTVFPYPMTVERLNGFEGPITVQIGDRQNRDLDGVEMIPFVIPPGQTEGHLPIYLPETMHINIQSQSQLYSQAFAQFKDQHGRQQSVLVLSEKRNMLRTRPLVVKMSAARPSITADPGQTVACQLTLERTTNFPGPMTIKLHETSGSQGFTAEPVTFAAGRSTATVTVQVPSDANARRATTLTFRATGKMPNGFAAITEAKVRFVPSGTLEK